MTAAPDNFIQSLLTARDTIAATLQDPFEADSAVLFLLDADSNVHELSRYEDVYSGLQETSAVALQPGHVAVGVMTTGWAAPLSGETPESTAPSEHPDRERVQLCVACDRNFRVLSIVTFSGKDESFIEDSGEGPFADALAITMLTMLRTAARRSRDMSGRH